MTDTSLLPLQPIPPDSRQEKLTRDLLTNLEGLAALLLKLRQEVDLKLAPQFPSFGDKPYPLGRCREIRDAVYDKLVAEIKKPTTDAGLNLNLFIRNGGIGRKIWGVLRESYFQNAIQLGTYYVDVANDTVVASKPKIEILPLEESGMVAVRDFFHFAAIARSYWESEVFANIALPGIAGLFPLICKSKTGGISIAPGSDQMIAMTRNGKFQPAIDFLEQSMAPPDALRESLQRQSKDFAEHAILQLRGDAVECVKKQQSDRLYESRTYYETCVSAFRALNQ